MSAVPQGRADWVAEMLERYAQRVRAGELFEFSVEFETDYQKLVRFELDFGPVNERIETRRLPEDYGPLGHFES